MNRIEVLKKTYEAEGFDWQSIEQDVNHKGFLYSQILPEFNEENFDHFVDCIRPKSLEGFETNNGWTKVEPGLKLPKHSFFCVLILKTGRRTVGQYNHKYEQFCILHSGYMNISKISHFAEIGNQKKPFF